MAQVSSILKTQDGSALVIALMMLALLTVIGIAATTTSEIGVRIANNDRLYQRDFYVADGGWKDAAMWLNAKAGPPPRVSSSPVDPTVKYFGTLTTDMDPKLLPAGTEDNSIGGVPYWYKVAYVSKSVVPGSGKKYKRFKYHAVSSANRTQRVAVNLSKIYKVGY